MANNILEMALELLEHEQKFLPSTLSAWFGDATVVRLPTTALFCTPRQTSSKSTLPTNSSNRFRTRCIS